MPAHGTFAWANSVRLNRYRAGSAIRGRISQHGPGGLLFYPAFEVHAQQFCAAGALKILIAPSAASIELLGERLPLVDAPYTRSAEIADLGLRMAAELRRRDDFSPIIVQGLLLETVGLFSRTASRSAKGELPWLRAARAFVESHCTEAVSLDAVAHIVGQSLALDRFNGAKWVQDGNAGSVYLIIQAHDRRPRNPCVSHAQG